MATLPEIPELPVEQVSRSSFAPFGDLIEADEATAFDTINAGTTRRFTDLTRVRLSGNNAQASVHIYRAAAVHEPVELRQLERHPHGSQLFMPLQGQAFIAVVADGDAVPDAGTLRAFLVSAGRGINLGPGVWHHPLLSLADSDFLVVERADPAHNLEEHALPAPLRLALPPGIPS
jgi:ureidoglycolate lyase